MKNGIPQRWQEAREKNKALYRKNIIKKKSHRLGGVQSVPTGGATPTGLLQYFLLKKYSAVLSHPGRKAEEK